MDLQELKTIIRSLIISLPTGMNIKKLEQDFKANEGINIPYRSFNCNSTEMLLATMPDTVKVEGYGPYATVLPVVTKEVAHIENMILAQKKPIAKHRNRFVNQQRRRKGVTYTDNRSDYTFKPYAGAYNENRNDYTFKPYAGVYNECSNRIPPLLSLDVDPSLFNFTSSQQHNSPATTNLAPIQNLDTLQTSEEERYDDLFIYSSDEEAFEFKDDFTKHIPTVIKDNLKTLIKENKDGIWCTKLPELYRSRFGKKLNFEDFGYSRLISMCTDLELFHAVCIDNGDHKLYDIDEALPSDAHLSFASSKYIQEEADVESNEPAISNEHELLITKFSYPPEVFKPGEEIPPQWLLPDMKKDTYVEIKVGEVYDLSKFWTFLQHPDCGDKLDGLMSDMQIYYQMNNMTLRIPPEVLKHKMIVCTKYMTEYHRAIVVKFLAGEDNVKVYFFDYGTIDSVKKSSLLYLHRSFGHLPRQAIRTRLTGVYPNEVDSQWSRESASRFLELVTDKRLIAYLQRIDHELQEIGVVLYDTEGGEDICIGDILVAEGYAVNNYKSRRQSSNKRPIIPVIPNIHLYPMFNELEMAQVPNALETIFFLNKGYTLDFIYPHYFTSVPEEEYEVEEATRCLESLQVVTNDAVCNEHAVEHDRVVVVDDDDALNTPYSKEVSLGLEARYDSPSSDKCSAADSKPTCGAAWTNLFKEEEMQALPKLPPGFSRNYVQRVQADNAFSFPASCASSANLFEQYVPNAASSCSPSFLSSTQYESSPSAGPFSNTSNGFAQFPPSHSTVPPNLLGNGTSPVGTHWNDLLALTAAQTQSNHQTAAANPLLNYLSQSMNFQQQLVLAQYLKQQEEQVRLINLLQQNPLFAMASKAGGASHTNVWGTESPNLPVPNSNVACTSSIVQQPVTSANDTNSEANKTSSSTDSSYRYDIRQHRRSILKTVLDNKTVHIINYKDELYMLTDEVTKYFTKYGSLPLNKRLKSIVMSGCSLPVVQINLGENNCLLNDLKESNLADHLSSNFLNVMPLKKINEFLNSLPGNDSSNLINFTDILKQSNV